jgi:hypothetical protein
MHRRDVSRALFASAVGTVAAPAASEAQTCAPPRYPQTLAERQAGVIPTNESLRPGNVDRYFVNDIPGSTDATSAFASAIRQAQQVSPSGDAIGAPVTVNGPLAIDDSVTIPAAGGASIGATVLLEINSGSIRIADSKTLQINGAFSAPRIACFVGKGCVAFGAGTCQEAYPEWWGARADSAPGLAGTIGKVGTDCTRAINAALLACAGGINVEVGLIPLRLAAGYYLCGNVTLYPASCVRGMGREVSGVLAASSAGSDGSVYWWTDNGSAAKIILEDFAMYGCYAVASRVNTLCRLGYGTTPFGSEGYLRGMWFRDCASSGGGWALDVQGNVGFFDLISIYGNSLPGQNLLRLGGRGAANMFSKIALLGAGPDCASFHCDGPATSIEGLEIEAPASTTTAAGSKHALYLGNNTVIHGLTLSGADQTVRDAWIEFGAACTAWEITGVNFFFNTNGTALVTHGNARRADGSYFGGKALAVRGWKATVAYLPGNIVGHGGCCWTCRLPHVSSRSSQPPSATYWELYSDGYAPSTWEAKQAYPVGSIVAASDGYNYIGIRDSVAQAPPDPTYWARFVPEPRPLTAQGNWSSENDGRRPQGFTLRIRNDGAGVLRHQISEAGGATRGTGLAIKNVTPAFSITPVGPDESVALVAGGKIGSPSRELFWLDTPNQSLTDTSGVACVSLNSTGIPLNVVASVVNAAIHGANANRLCLRVTNAATGEGFALTPANFGGNEGRASVQISWLGSLSG